MRELERRVVLSVLDRKWREHLYEMDYLQEGIGLRAMAQRDPLVEYQREGFDMFTAMMDGIKEESVGYLFNLEVQVGEQPECRRRRRPRRPPRSRRSRPCSTPRPPRRRRSAPRASARSARTHLEYTAPSVDGEAGVVHASEEVEEAIPELGPDASRAERRRAERAARKRGGGQK